MNNLSRKNNKPDQKKWWYIGIAITSVVLISAAIIGYRYWVNKQREKQANEAAGLFLKALETQDYHQLSTLLSASSLEEIGYTKEKVQKRYETIYGGIGVTDVEVNNMELVENETNDQLSLRYDLNLTTSLGQLEPQFYETTLYEEAEGFAVDWDTSLIFPEMELNDTVQIEFMSGKRGNILDRNGELLAGEGSARQAGLYPALLEEGEGREKNLQTIADTFDLSKDQLENLLSADWVTDESFVPFAIVNEEETPEVNGVVYQETTIRTYPLGEAGAHLIGYIGGVFAEDIEANPSLQTDDVIGKAGLEATFDERLRGSKGGKISIVDDTGEEKKTLQEATVEDGEDITLTIDSVLQQRYFEGFNDKNGAAVVMAPTSGELLVLTSSPSYDPTRMAQGISDEEYRSYSESPDSPFLPRYSARYAPASTFKIITAAIGLDAGVTNLEETRSINGFTWKKDESWGNYEVKRVSDQPTEVGLEDALIYSDNIFFAQEAIEMGAETFINGLKKFPFGEKMNLPINMKPAQITNSGTFESEPLFVDTAFGQGQLLMSPLHQIVFYTPFVNDGDLVFPKLETHAETSKPIQPITQETAETIKKILVQVVENPNGTAHALNKASFALGAKTGTGEFQSTEPETHNETNGFLYVFDAAESAFSSIIFIENESGSNVAKQFAPIIRQED